MRSGPVSEQFAQSPQSVRRFNLAYIIYAQIVVVVVVESHTEPRLEESSTKWNSMDHGYEDIVGL